MDSLKNKITSLKESSFVKIMMEYSRVLIILLFIAYVVTIFVITAKTPEKFMSKPLTIMGLILIPVMLIAYLYLFSGEMSMNYNIMIAAMIMGIVVSVGYLLYFYISSPKENIMTNTLSYLSMLVIFAIILTGLIIYYNVFVNSIKKLRGWSGFFTHLLFYLPCLITDYMKYLFVEVTSTPPIVFIFFVVEICLFLLYIYLPSIVNAIYIPKGVTLLHNPVFLTPEYNDNQIAEASTFLIDPPLPIDVDGHIKESEVKPEKIYNKNFSLSMWIYVNNTILGNNRKESVIFKYGTVNDFYGKPCITYLGNDDWRFMFTNNHGYSETEDLTKVPLPEYIVKMPSQKWHHVVFSYYENKVDLYINGSLARSMDISDQLPKMYDNDVVVVGSKDPNNIPGAICNVKYYKTPLSSAQISRIYNMLFMSNPPVNNLP
jgi:hypothetical protein